MYIFILHDLPRYEWNLLHEYLRTVGTVRPLDYETRKHFGARAFTWIFVKDA